MQFKFKSFRSYKLVSEFYQDVQVIEMKIKDKLFSETTFGKFSKTLGEKHLH